MNDPTLEYESRTRAAPRSRSGLGIALAVLSLLAGATLAYLFIVGLGAGDTWVIYPPHLPAYLWLAPAALVGWPVWYFARPAAKN